VIYPTKFKSTSLARGVFLKQAFRMLTLLGRSGKGIYIN
jgi:hypothetical protein